MTTTLTKGDYREACALLYRLRPLGARPMTVDEQVRLEALIAKMERVVVEMRPVLEKGELVLSWRVPREQALTMNEYAYKKGWQKTKIRAELDAAVRALFPAFPKADLHAAKKKRWVRATRFSTKEVDETSLDVLGAKMPVDALVRCGVLVDDDATRIIRQGRCEKTKRGNTHVLVEVFEVTTDGRAIEEPAQAIAPAAPPRQLGAFTKAVIG